MASQTNELKSEEVNTGSVSGDLLKIMHALYDTKDILTKFVDGVTIGSDVSLKFDSNFKKIKGFTNKKLDDYIDLLLKNHELFKDEGLLNILHNDVMKLHSSVLQSNLSTPYEIAVFYEGILDFMDSFRGIEIGVIALKNANTIINNELKPKIEEVKEKVKDFESLRLALEQRETIKIYLDLHKKYHGEYFVNNILFFVTIILAVFFTLYTTTEISNIPQFNDYKTARNFWVMFITIKVLIATVTLTFGTLFLRRSSHAKKLKEQAYQTHVEINAFPIHVRSLRDEDKYELIKELAMKYFGKELDQTQNDKIGDLMKDQLAAGTELIKASAEMVKNAKSLSSSADKAKNIKTNNTSIQDKTKSEDEG